MMLPGRSVSGSQRTKRTYPLSCERERERRADRAQPEADDALLIESIDVTHPLQAPEELSCETT